jgi:hypothetical protein
VHHGCVAGANGGGGGSGGVVADIAKLSVGREVYYTHELAVQLTTADYTRAWVRCLSRS